MIKEYKENNPDVPPNMRAISPSLGSCFISSLFMQKQFRYFWLSFNPFSNSSIVGIDDLKSFGKSLGADIPIYPLVPCMTPRHI